MRTECIFIRAGKMILEKISPTITFITPPEKLVLEIRTSGPFRHIRWKRNGIFLSKSPERIIAHFGEIYVKNNTNLQALGKYDVSLVPAASGQAVPPMLSFFVVLPG